MSEQNAAKAVRHKKWILWEWLSIEPIQNWMKLSSTIRQTPSIPRYLYYTILSIYLSIYLGTKNYCTIRQTPRIPRWTCWELYPGLERYFTGISNLYYVGIWSLYEFKETICLFLLLIWYVSLIIPLSLIHTHLLSRD